MTPHLEASPPAYVPRDPSQTVIYRVVADHLETFLVSLDAAPDAKGLPAYVERELYDYLQCGILAHGFVRLGCDTCKHEMLLAFSCKRRGFCPSCAGAQRVASATCEQRRMAQTAAHVFCFGLPSAEGPEADIRVYPRPPSLGSELRRPGRSSSQVSSVIISRQRL